MMTYEGKGGNSRSDEWCGLEYGSSEMGSREVLHAKRLNGDMRRKQRQQYRGLKSWGVQDVAVIRQKAAKCKFPTTETVSAQKSKFQLCP